MPAARGTKRAAPKASATSAASTAAPKNKKKRGAVVPLEIPTLPRIKGRVFTCGQGDVGQLGLGDSVPESTKFRHVPALGDKIAAVSAGGMHTIAVDSSGKVWTYGCNDEGALGRNTTSDEDEGEPKKVALPAKAVRVTAGDSHSAALLENGDVYAWGSFRDSHGSMGLVMQGREHKSSKEPIKIDVGETAADIASGSDHLVILTTGGTVLTMGCGEQGQLGRLPQRSASREARQGFSALLVPTKVTLKAGASRVWAGYHATFVLDASQEKVFAFGLNNYGQLGITGEKRKSALYGPTECDAFAAAAGGAWRAVQPGQHHSLALDARRRVLAVGRCEYGRLGLGDREGDAETLIPVPKLEDKKCISIAAGTSNSFAVTETGEVFSWGMGSEGQLGTGLCADAAAPAAAVCVARGQLAPRAVAAGGQHSVLLLEDPNPEKESSPVPEVETAEQKTEASTEEELQEKEKPRPKRQKREQEEEVTSTSASEATEVNKPQKLNGDEKKISPMDVDQTDNTDTSQDAPEDTKREQPEKMDTETADKPETTDTSSQGTTDSENHSQDTDNHSQDTSNKGLDKPAVELNGTDSDKVEVKSVEVTNNPIVTTA